MPVAPCEPCRVARLCQPSPTKGPARSARAGACCGEGQNLDSSFGWEIRNRGGARPKQPNARNVNVRNVPASGIRAATNVARRARGYEPRPRGGGGWRPGFTRGPGEAARNSKTVEHASRSGLAGSNVNREAPLRWCPGAAGARRLSARFHAPRKPAAPSAAVHSRHTPPRRTATSSRICPHMLRACAPAPGGGAKATRMTMPRLPR
jgi:hypothetical protein